MNTNTQRRGTWLPICLGAVLWIAVLSMASGKVCAQTSAPALTDRQDTLVHLYLQTRKCMRSAGRAAHERSDSPRDVQYFMVSVCSTALMQFLMDDMSEDEARHYVLNITHRTYYEDVLGIPEPK